MSKSVFTRTRAVLLLLGLPAMASCGITHHIRLSGSDLDPVPLSASTHKRVAVVFAPPDFVTTQESSTDGHRFVFEDLNIFYERAFRSALQGRVGTLDFIFNPAPGYDAYVYPSLSLEVGGAFVHRCTARYGLRVTDARGRTIASRTAQGQHPYGPASAAESACTAAMLLAYADVTLPVLASIDAIDTINASGGEQMSQR